MVISYSLKRQLDSNISLFPPETGGILGCRGDDGVIAHIVFDDGVKPDSLLCEYKPNTQFLNTCIDKWFNYGIQFVGMFHTHLYDVKALSNGDIEYIRHIMRSLPPGLNSLYFPLYVLPCRELVGYRAYISDGNIKITTEEVIITKKYY